MKQYNKVIDDKQYPITGRFLQLMDGICNKNNIIIEKPTSYIKTEIMNIPMPLISYNNDEFDKLYISNFLKHIRIFIFNLITRNITELRKSLKSKNSQGLFARIVGCCGTRSDASTFIKTLLSVTIIPNIFNISLYESLRSLNSRTFGIFLRHSRLDKRSITEIIKYSNISILKIFLDHINTDYNIMFPQLVVGALDVLRASNINILNIVTNLKPELNKIRMCLQCKMFLICDFISCIEILHIKKNYIFILFILLNSQYTISDICNNTSNSKWGSKIKYEDLKDKVMDWIWLSVGRKIMIFKYHNLPFDILFEITNQLSCLFY